MTLRFVDLFAGIGGFHEALSGGFGAECVLASDIDPDCRAVYQDNFGIEPWGDINDLTPEGGPLRVPEHDVLCAGFPCQPFSKSGFQRGINETRGTLFYNILRVLEGRRPRWVILENVRNLAGPRHRHTWATIVKQLRALGYRVADEPAVFSPHLLPPDQGGRPQVRERVFVLCQYVGEGAHPDDLRGEPLLTNQPVGGWDPMRWRIEDYLQDDAEVPSDRYALRQTEVAWLDTWNDLLGSLPADVRLPGFPIWLDAFEADPDIDPETPDWKADFLRKNSRFYVAHQEVIDAWIDRHPELAEFPNSRRKFEWQAQQSARDVWGLVAHLRPSGIRVKRPTYLPALVAITQTSIIGWKRRRITPREAARLQGFDDSFRLHEEDAVAYRQLGNAVNVGVVEHAARALFATAVEPAVEDELVVAAAS
ncbi:MAG TPA: DNA cytosine methyltransferase [Candidatus Limnocylindria bacterium]|nr:DNA cytosine methyltransferase [Candidatus Limnocylindria bacterium]